MDKCARCGGSGYVYLAPHAMDGFTSSTVPCPACNPNHHISIFEKKEY